MAQKKDGLIGFPYYYVFVEKIMLVICTFLNTVTQIILFIVPIGVPEFSLDLHCIGQYRSWSRH